MFGIFGTITNPTSLPDGPTGFFDFLSTIFKLAGVAAGIFFIFKIIVAGFMYLSADGDQKKIDQAWSTIWQSIIGFVIVASAFVIASAVGYIFHIDPLNPTFSSP